MLHDGLSQWFSDRGNDWMKSHWQRVVAYDPTLPAAAPSTLPLAYCFKGAGHVYMRSAWNDPNATWAFFGVGPQYAAHSRDDEGHFLIGKQGSLVSRQGGQGGNDSDYYSGGSLIYNIVTIYDPNEKFRRDQKNENDGGLLRHVYQDEDGYPHTRGHLTAFDNAPKYTYAAADITEGYNPAKAREVTRQFLYLRGEKEFFVVFDRVEATKPDFRRHFFLHLPTEPKVDGTLTTWLSLPEADGDLPEQILSKGRSRMFLHTLLPVRADIVKRGGPGQEAWGHPLEPTAQYNHIGPDGLKPPICPWRLEVGDPTEGARSLFLHVFEITGEEVQQPTDVKFVAPAGVDIGDLWQVRFNADGILGGTVNGQALSSEVKVESQYK
jgi:heparin/heparan-sulfate lyase